jgi:2-keto-4-pentenoate hydratase/2-oxohepta-3-ene-1,7-dioic acid hydratase in catechol pathway
VTRLVARARHGTRLLSGEVEGDRFVVVEGEVPRLGARTGESLALDDVRLLAPVLPSKVVGIALNYRAHAAEMNKPLPSEPMFFLKPSTSIIGPGDTILLPPDSAEVHHEAEVGLVVGKPLWRASADEARAALFGVTGVVDVTARDVQRRQNHYTRGKGYDTFCPIGPVIACGVDPCDLRVRLSVNGEWRQDGRSSDMVFGPYELLSFVSQVMTLLPGDVVATGTPPGVGAIAHGDRVLLDVEAVGTLELSVTRA